jgi:hypothetical protein
LAAEFPMGEPAPPQADLLAFQLGQLEKLK